MTSFLSQSRALVSSALAFSGWANYCLHVCSFPKLARCCSHYNQTSCSTASSRAPNVTQVILSPQGSRVHYRQTKMKLFVTTAIVLLLALICGTNADLQSEQCLSAPDLCLHNASTSNTLAGLKRPVIRANTPQPVDNEDWIVARCRGERLLHAMKLTDQDEASKVLQWPYTESPWDSDLKKQLETWGYSEEERPDTCDFEYKQFDRAFEALGIDTSAVVEGGRNTCYKFRHYNGPKVERNEDGKLPDKYIQRYKVDEKTYRVSRI
jgi:hypothetical protein